MMIQCCSYQQNGKRCTNLPTKSESYCSLHSCNSVFLLKCDHNLNGRNVDLSLQQSGLEEKTTNLIQRVKRLQLRQLSKHLTGQLCAYLRYQKDQLNYTCQHPQYLNRADPMLLFDDKNLVLSTLQSQNNISQEDKLKLLSHGVNFKNLPTSQLVKLVKKFKQDNQPVAPLAAPISQQAPQSTPNTPLSTPSSSIQPSITTPPLPTSSPISSADHKSHHQLFQNSCVNNQSPSSSSLYQAPIAQLQSPASSVLLESEKSKLVNGVHSSSPFQSNTSLVVENNVNSNTNSDANNSHISNPQISIKQEPYDVSQQQNVQQSLQPVVGEDASGITTNNQTVCIKEEKNSSVQSTIAATKRRPLASTNNTSYSSNIIVNRKCIAPKFTSDQIKQIHTTTGILRTNLRHLEHSFDSDATDSSSGGESCDELDDYLNDLCKQQKLDYNSITPLALSQKANWKWACERASIVSRYTWLQAQIADLDFRIRQQNEIYKQFRLSKGPISFYSSESHQNSASSEPQSCVRTLPLKEMKKRKLVRAMFALANANRKVDRHSTVLCSCNSLPSFANSCVLCNERYSYIQMIDTDCMTIPERVALLDASYHSVLSLPENVSLGLHFSKLLKKETVQRPAIRNANYKKKKIGPKGELSLKFKSELKPKKKSQALIQSTKLKKKYEGNNKKHQLLSKKTNKVRLNSSTASNNNNRSDPKGNSKDRYDSPNFSDESSRHDSPLPSPFVNNDGSLISSSLRRRRSEQNAYDPFNIVIPYSIASTTRVERLQYKEIITPKWRVTEDALDELNEMEIDTSTIETCEKICEPITPVTPVTPTMESSVKSERPRRMSSNSMSYLNKLLLNKSIDKMDTSEPSSPIDCTGKSPKDEKSVEDMETSSANNTRQTTEIDDHPITMTNAYDDETSNLSQSTDELEKSDSLEDLSDETFIERHLKCEADEKKRFSSYLKNPINGGSRGRGAVRQRTESTKSESMNLETNTIDGSSQDSFSNMQINLNVSTIDKSNVTATSGLATNSAMSTASNTPAKSPVPDCNSVSMVFEDNSNQSTSKTRTYSLSSHKDDQLFKENQVEVVPYEKRNFPLDDNEFHNLLS